MNYEICKKVMTADIKRAGFNALAKQTFWLSFENWYQSGKWSEWNQPYTMYDGDKAISNITVNQMKVLYEGKIRNYVQLGGVMTDPDYRNQGLSRKIMEEVIKDWKSKCDCMFLLANQSVTEFYPKFGFVEETQYQYSLPSQESKQHNKEFKFDSDKITKLDLNQKEDMECLMRCYNKKNPFSKLQIIDNNSLLYFYCEDAIRDNIYYIQDEDAIVIAECEDDEISIFDIYYDGSKSLLQILGLINGNYCPVITLLFTPVDSNGLIEKQFKDDDTHLFILDGKENIFKNNHLYIPDISHT